MTLEPRTVAPGFWRRWPREAAALMLRSYHWGVLPVLALGLLAGLTPWAQWLALPLGLVVYAAQCELVARADRQEVTAADMAECLVQAGAVVLREAWSRRWLLGVVVGLGVLLGSVLVGAVKPLLAQASRLPPDLGQLGTWLWDVRSPLSVLSAFVWAGAFLQADVRAHRLRMLDFCLLRWSGAASDARVVLLLKAAYRNPQAAYFVELLHMALLVLGVLVLPGALLVVAGFLPALSYVAFREMYVDGEGNRTLAPRRSVKTRMARASSPA